MLNSPGSIYKALGMCDAMCVPHIVSITKKAGTACNDGCIAWKSQKFCSHVLAIAEETNCLDEFLIWYRKLKVTGNYTAVSMYNQSKSVGKNPGTSKKRDHLNQDQTLKIM